MFKRRFTLALMALALGAGCGDQVVTPQPDAVSVRRSSASIASTLSVSIYGADSLVPRGTYCTWNAGVSGGTPPYQFQWRGYQGNGTMSSYTELMPNWHGEIIYIELFVTDANGQSGSASVMPITASPSTPC
jgi:hypothetical protein